MFTSIKPLSNGITIKNIKMQNRKINIFFVITSQLFYVYVKTIILQHQIYFCSGLGGYISLSSKIGYSF